MVMMKTKICVDCKRYKVLDEYSKRRVAKDGRDSYCKDCRNAISRDYYARTQPQQIARVQKYQDGHAEQIIEYTREYNSRKEVKERQKLYTRNRRQTDPLFKLISAIRRNTSEIFKGIRRNKRTLELLGCSFEDAKKYLESLFRTGMSWENYGNKGWHIDHIYPLSKATSIEHLEKLCHYTNLQPLWWYENLSKSDKIPVTANLSTE
jgi:hypothetical protein